MDARYQWATRRDRKKSAMVIAPTVTVERQPASAGVAPPASRRSRVRIFAGIDPVKGGQVDLVDRTVVFFRQLAERRRSLFAHHAVGEHPWLGLTETVPDPIPPLLEMVPPGNAVVVVAGAAGLPGAQGLVGRVARPPSFRKIACLFPARIA